MRELLVPYLSTGLALVYWASLAVIGFAALRFTWKKYFKAAKVDGVTDNPFLLIILSFGASVVMFGVASLPLYALQLPAIVYTVIYLGALLGAVVYLMSMVAGALAKKRSVTISGWRFWLAFTAGLSLVGILVFDYVVSTYFGAQFAEGSDTYVHVAKILSIWQYGFSIDDGFLEGVAETRYHFNAIYPLYLPIIQLGHVTPADAWNVSTGFFRFIQWITAGALMTVVARRLLRLDSKCSLWLGVVATVAAVAAVGGSRFMHVAMYPNTIENIWLVLLVVGLFLVVDSHRKLGVAMSYMAALLITLTHPTYALMAALFVALLFAGSLIGYWVKLYRLDGRYLLTLGGLFVILMLSPVITILFPDRMTDASFDFGNFKSIEVLGVDILPVALPDTPLSVLFATISLIGYGFIVARLWVQKKYQLLIAVLALVLFVYLLVNNPMFMAIVGDILPLWLLARFGAMNVLSLIIIPVGLYTIGLGVLRLVGKRELFRKVLICASIVIAVTGLGLSALRGYKSFYDNTKAIDHGYLDFVHRTQQTLGGVFQPGSVVIANLGDSYFLPASLPIKVIAVHAAHATPEADSANRLLCQEELYAGLFDNRLVATTGARYIVVAKWDAQYNGLIAKLSQDAMYRHIKDTPDFMVYEIIVPNTGDVIEDSPCRVYKKVEGVL